MALIACFDISVHTSRRGTPPARWRSVPGSAMRPRSPWMPRRFRRSIGVWLELLQEAGPRDIDLRPYQKKPNPMISPVGSIHSKVVRMAAD